MADLRRFRLRALPRPGSFVSRLGDGHRDDHLPVAVWCRKPLHSRSMPGCEFLPLSWSPSTVALLTGRADPMLAMRCCWCGLAAAAAAGLDGPPDRHVPLAVLFLLPGSSWPGRWHHLSPALASGGAFGGDPARAGWRRPGYTLSQGVTPPACRASRPSTPPSITGATLHALAGLPAPSRAARAVSAGRAPPALSRVSPQRSRPPARPRSRHAAPPAPQRAQSTSFSPSAASAALARYPALLLNRDPAISRRPSPAPRRPSAQPPIRPPPSARPATAGP